MTASMRPTTFASKPKHEKAPTKHPKAKCQKNGIFKCHLGNTSFTNLSSHEFSGTSSRNHAIRSNKLQEIFLVSSNPNRNSAHSLDKRHPKPEITRRAFLLKLEE